nr:hypothetical protein [Cupriavidus basilensis]
MRVVLRALPHLAEARLAAGPARHLRKQQALKMMLGNIRRPLAAGRRQIGKVGVAGDIDARQVRLGQVAPPCHKTRSGRMRGDAGQVLVRHADAGQDLLRSRIDDMRLRREMQVIALLDQERRDALIRQQRRHEHANGARAHDQNRNFQLPHTCPQCCLPSHGHHGT